MVDIGLTDVHSFKHGHNDNFSTYQRGKRRLDYLFASRRVLDHITRCGYEKFDARINSDHRGYFVDISVPGFFDRRLPQLFSPSARSIKGSHPSNITKYIKALHKYMVDQNIILRVREVFYCKLFVPEKVEKLDKSITEGMLAAERICLII